jgi:FkbM family methyltransferase
MEKELNNLLSKPASYYKKLILANNPEFDFRKPVILFGAGNIGKELLSFFKRKGTKVIAFSDNDANKVGKYHYGINVINKKQIAPLYGKDIQIVASSVKYSAIIHELKKLKFTYIWEPMYFLTLYTRYFNIFVWSNNIDLILKNKSKIRSVFNSIKDKESKQIMLNIVKFRLLLDGKLLRGYVDKFDQYFNSKIIKLKNNEIFLDGGAYDGNTTRTFIKKTKNRFSNIHAFEPDKVNFRNLYYKLKPLSDNRIHLYNLGVGDTKRTLSFSNDGNVSSRLISGDNANKVKIVPIDKLRQAFTYMKFDIEGYEKQAILGAKKTLITYKPKLAVSVYHHLEDLWEIPLIIKKINPTYKIFLRRYTSFLHEIVCYAN